MKLKVGHTFDLFERIDFYHSLWENDVSMYGDHTGTTENVYKLKEFIEKQPKDCCLTHIDAVPDNFLFYKLLTLSCPTFSSISGFPASAVVCPSATPSVLSFINRIFLGINSELLLSKSRPVLGA